MGIPRGPSLTPSWTRNLGLLRDQGGIRVIARCRHCQQSRTIDLDALIEKVGRDYSLWDRRPPCKLTPGCPGRVHFRWSTGTWDYRFETD